MNKKVLNDNEMSDMMVLNNNDKDNKDTSGNNSGNMIERTNRLPLNFQYKFPVQNKKISFLLKNLQRTDVRVYELLVTVMPKKVRAILEM